ncbi:MAG: hypothetical protein PHU23_16875 [Dehalococcoidales bacterium]|nr:hypothetical protein [Dehalococcoidales bacterium]
MSKESRIKKNEERIARKNPTARPPEPAPHKESSPPVISFRRQNRKLNKRFIITLAIWVVALIAALYFLSR